MIGMLLAALTALGFREVNVAKIFEISETSFFIFELIIQCYLYK